MLPTYAIMRSRCERSNEAAQLSEATIPGNDPVYDVPVTSHRLAWGVLFVSFAVFCVLCAVTTIALQIFLFQSTIGLDVTLQPGRGTAIVQDGSGVLPPVVDPREFSRGMSVQTDATDERAQVSLIFRDPGAANDVLATVTALSDSFVRLRSSSRPRFDWTIQDRYRIDLANLSGEIEIYVEHDLPLPIEINVWTVNGTRIILTQAGHYSIISTGSVPRIVNWSGQAVMIPPDSNIGQSVGAGQSGVLASDASRVELRPAPRNVIENGEFDEFVPGSGSSNVSPQPVAWQCTLTPNQLPRGSYEYGTAPDGRPAFRLVRGDGAANNGETSCEQPINISPSETQSLEFKVTLYIAHQSISACGIAASECPLMLQIDYVGGDGGQRSLRHGIYARFDPSTGWPLLCDTCAGRDHIRIHQSAWYTYESGNLLPLMRVRDPENLEAFLPPRSIDNVRIYASGHEYDVFIEEVALIAEATPEEPLDFPVNGG